MLGRVNDQLREIGVQDQSANIRLWFELMSHWARRREVQTGDNDILTLERPRRRTVARRTPKQRLRLTAGILIGLYLANVAANVLYKVATQWQIDLLDVRIESLARLDPDDPEIARIRQVIDAAGYASLTEAAPQAIARRSTVKTYLKRHPHLSLGIAVDGDGYRSDRVIGMLRNINWRLRPHRLSVGLAEPAISIRIPAEATREDILRGITTAFRHRPDHVIAMTAKTCRYTAANPGLGEQTGNRLYSFGRMGLTVVDGAVIGEELTRHLQTEIASFLRQDNSERRWQAADYAVRAEDILTDHRIIGRLWRDTFGETVAQDDRRSVQVSVGLDGVSEAEARAAIDSVNAVFRSEGIRFVIQHLAPHRLTDQWKWPVEMEKMLRRGESDIFVLLTASDWASPDRGPVRGLANATVGAVMIQMGTPGETAQRLAHELGHLFGLPHTLLSGHVMYPYENAIGLAWSPGSQKLLAKNRTNMRWFSSITSPVRFDMAVRMAPVMRRSAAAGGAATSEAFARGDVWIRCSAQ